MPACRIEAEASKRKTAEPVAERFPVAFPTVSDTHVEREYVAEVRAIRYAEIRARVKGIVEKVWVDEGEAVRAGQHLFSIGARVLEQELAATQAAMAATEAELLAARLELENTQLLLDENVVSAAALGSARTSSISWSVASHRRSSVTGTL